jgi:hypothetical protein
MFLYIVYKRVIYMLGGGYMYSKHIRSSQAVMMKDFQSQGVGGRQSFLSYVSQACNSFN